jgi:hypothetical protein
VEILNLAGEHLRFVHGELAAALVANGHAEVAARNGRVRQIRLIETAAHAAAMIGPPTPAGIPGVKFYRREKLDSGAVVWAHHPRATNYGE